ncbi:enolase C-terminal domain-like protein [Flavobacterium sp.]|uniref:enolase C-terminal domain-like protein n=1 Tax=Flavobacterium sp. TaxID=239 RepID=UPI0037538FC1
MKLSWQIVRLDLKETFSIAYGNYSFREALIISLKSHNISGFGECTAIDYYQINLVDFITKLKSIQDEIEKHNWYHPTDFYNFLVTLNLPSFLRSALDCAFWDLFGKLEKKSFLELNSIAINQLPESSITISVAPIETQIQKIKISTWGKFKIKCSHFNKQEIKSLLQLDYSIALDSNGSFNKEDCIWLENQQSTNNFSYLEQPMKKGFENYAVLHSDLNANWMADEDCQDATLLNQLKPHYKSINIKLVKCGGLTPALQMIDIAKQLNYKIMIGCMTESTIGISAAAVLAPFCDFADLDGANLIVNDLANGSKIINGKIYLSENPGLGIQIIS